MLMKLFDRNGNDRNTAHSAHAGAAHAGAGVDAAVHIVSFDWRLSTLYLHSVSYVYAVLPFYDVKCLCSGGRE